MPTSRADTLGASTRAPASDTLPEERVADYAYLWDGSSLGWIPKHRHRSIADLTLVFAASGPSVQDVAALRTAMPDYASQPAAQVLLTLKGCERVALGSHDGREAREMAERCRRSGLSVEVVTKDMSGYLPYNEVTRSALIIEDDDLAKRVYEKAIREGIRVEYTEA